MFDTTDAIRRKQYEVEVARDELEILLTRKRQIHRQITDALERSLRAQREILLIERGVR